MAPRKVVILPPQYLPTAEWFAALAGADLAVVDADMRYDKRRKSVHRAYVKGQHGLFAMTVPVSHASGIRTWAQATVSDHGHWWTVHCGAIESAYARTPYFEHYWPMLRPLIASQAVSESVTLFDSHIEAVLRRIIGISVPVSAMLPPGTDPDCITDLRRHNFDGETVLDTIFSHGPNAASYLNNLSGLLTKQP